jgi:hypothetical protein
VPKINLPATGHVGPVANPGGPSYLPYTNAGYLATLRLAIHIIDTRIKGHVPCDNAFKALPGGRSFAEIWNDPNVWINFDPSLAASDFGATRQGTKESTISANALKRGRWTVAATLVHEMAHVDGVGGAGLQAESVLKNCLLKDLYDLP